MCTDVRVDMSVGAFFRNVLGHVCGHELIHVLGNLLGHMFRLVPLHVRRHVSYGIDILVMA